MKQSSILLLIVSLTYIITGCNNLNSDIPLPEDKSVNAVTIPLHFSAPKKIKFSDTNAIEVSVKKLNFNMLPEKVFDSSGFKPFSKEADVVPFKWDSLPGTSFNYDSLPSRPFKFETFVLDPPCALIIS